MLVGLYAKSPILINIGIYRQILVNLVDIDFH
jgi:hypothetical protein